MYARTAQPTHKNKNYKSSKTRKFENPKILKRIIASLTIIFNKKESDLFSSKHTNAKFVEESIRLGELLALEGHLCVNGVGSSGCMGGVNKGGVGTFDEFWDAICRKSLGMKGLERKLIVLVNLDGFYDGFALQMSRAQKEGILYGKTETYYHVVSDVVSALEFCKLSIQSDEEKSHSGLLISNIKENNVEELQGRVKERLVPTMSEMDENVKDERKPTIWRSSEVMNAMFVGLAIAWGFRGLRLVAMKRQGIRILTHSQCLFFLSYQESIFIPLPKHSAGCSKLSTQQLKNSKRL
eukprot:gene31846-38507_t